MSEKNIKISSALSLPDVVGSIKKGKWKIPRFQREFVWEKSKVVDLLDSMYKEFPIGSFFLWVPPEEYVQYYKDIPELKITPDGIKFYTHFILDGQQRLTSLYVTAEGLEIDGFNYSNISFDLDTEKFNVGPPDNQRNISLHQILNAEKYLNVFNALTDDRKRIFMKAKDRLNNYPFPVVIIENKTIEDACKIFERINQGGKRLSIFDLVVALTWDKDFELKTEIDRFNKEVEPVFGKIDEEVFTEAISLIINKQCTKAFQLKLTPQDVKERWKSVQKAIGLSVQFLKTNLNIPRYYYLPYRDIIALLAYYFHECAHNKIEVDKKFLEEWFWKVSFANRYSGASFTKIGEDRASIFDRKIRNEPVDINYDINVTEEKIKTLNMGRSSALRNALLVILLQRTPLSFADNTPVDIEDDPISSFNRSERHHIFPKAYLRSIGMKGKRSIDLLANFCLIDAALNKDIRDKAPSNYFSSYKQKNRELEKALNSHLIADAEDSGIWSDDYSKFIEQRSKLLYREIKQRVGDLTATIEQQMASGPEKLIQRTEQAIRETINRVLYETYGEDWWDAEGTIPQDVGQSVREKIKRERANKPYISEGEWDTADRKLEQVNIMDYLKIIQRNWKLFEDIFISKNKLEQYFAGFSTIRNQIDHIKTLDPTEVKFGEASIEWLLKCMREEEEEKATPVKVPMNPILAKEIYEGLKARILALDPEITEKKKKYFSAFNKNNKFFNFGRLTFRQNFLRLRVFIGKDQLQETGGIGIDVSKDENKKKRRINFELSTISQIDDAMRLIFLAYKFNENHISKKGRSRNDLHLARLDFWKELLEKAKDANADFQNPTPRKYNWIGKSAGKSGLMFAIVILNESGTVELYLDVRDKEVNKNRFRRLESHKEEIEKSFGQPLKWDLLPDKRASRISFRTKGGLKNKDQWDEIQKRLVTQMIDFERAIQPYIHHLD